MSDTYTTPEGFTLPKPLLLPDVRDFAELFEYVREWDHTTMTAKDGVVPRHDLVPPAVRVGGVAIGPFLSTNVAGEQRAMAVKALPLTVDALVDPSEPSAPASIKNERRISFELVEHVSRGRVLVVARENQMIRGQYVAYIDPATIPAEH